MLMVFPVFLFRLEYHIKLNSVNKRKWHRVHTSPFIFFLYTTWKLVGSDIKILLFRSRSLSLRSLLEIVTHRQPVYICFRLTKAQKRRKNGFVGEEFINLVHSKVRWTASKKLPLFLRVCVKHCSAEKEK